MNAADIKRMTPRQVVEHMMDMEGRAHRLATENAGLREATDRLQTENQAMLNALVMANKALLLALKVARQTTLTPHGVSVIKDAFDAVTAFVGNVETETLTDKPADHGTV